MIATQNPPTSAIQANARSKTEKLLCLESIRGIAALIVVIHHLLYAFWPQVKHSDQAIQGTSWLYWFGATPLFALHNGFFSVRLFFVLSGFVLSFSYFNSGDTRVVSSAAFRRYFRLMPLAFASIMIAWLLLHFRLIFNQQALTALGFSKTEWLGSEFLNADRISFLGAVKNGMFDVFFRKECTLNRVLWTMPLELMGSYFVFSFLALFGGAVRRWLLYVVLFIVLDQTENYYFIDFLAGIVLCDLYKNYFAQKSIPLIAGISAVCFGLMIGGTPSFWFHNNHIPMLFGKLWATLGASAIIVGGMACIKLRNILECKFFAFLGKVSFSVYVIHVPIICSIGCYTCLTLISAGWSRFAASLISALSCVVFSYSAAWPMYRYIDCSSIRLGKHLEKRLFNARAFEARQAATE